MVSLLDFVHHIKFWLVESVSCISSIRLLLSVPVVTPARRDIAVADDAIAEIVRRNRHDHILNLACRPRIERSAHTAVTDGRTCRRNARDQSHTHMHLFVGSRTYILDQGGESLAPRNR